MQYEIGAMSVGDILDRSIRLMLARLGTFLGINAIFLTPACLLYPFVPRAMEGLANAGGGPGKPPDIEALLQFIGFMFLFAIMWGLCSCLSTAATLRVIAHEFVGQRASLGNALKFSMRNAWKLLLTSLASSFLAGAGLMACCVPSVFLYIWFIFSSQVVVVENIWGLSALQRSRELTRAFRLRVLSVVFLFFSINAIFNIGLMFLGALVPQYTAVQTDQGMTMVTNMRNFILLTLLQTVIWVVCETFAHICWTLFYFDLRIRKEGFDLELAARARPADKPPPLDMELA